MPSSAEPLAGLDATATRCRWLAVLWHVYFGLVALSLTIGFRAPRKLMGVPLGEPLLSVGGSAWCRARPCRSSSVETLMLCGSSRAWEFVLGAAGLFYGVFGAVRLGVAIDWVLAVGAAVLLGTAIGGGRTAAPVDFAGDG